MSFNLAVNNSSQVTGDYNQYKPFPAGTYQVTISEAKMETKQSGPQSKHPGKTMTMISLTFDVYGAGQDGNSRPYWEHLIVDHEVKDDKMNGFVQMNQNKLTDLILNFVSVNFGANVANSPFANGVNEQTIGYLTQTRPLNIEFKVNKKDDVNEVKSFFPSPAENTGTTTQPQNAPANQANQQQQDYQQMPQNNTSNAPQNNAPQNNAPQNNGGGFNPNNNMPAFHQQQRTG